MVKDSKALNGQVVVYSVERLSWVTVITVTISSVDPAELETAAKEDEEIPLTAGAVALGLPAELVTPKLSEKPKEAEAEIEAEAPSLKEAATLLEKEAPKLSENPSENEAEKPPVGLGISLVAVIPIDPEKPSLQLSVGTP